MNQELLAWIDWHHNPPIASHMGGVSERQTQTARNISEGLLRTHSLSLDSESLRTVMTEVELTVNSVDGLYISSRFSSGQYRLLHFVPDFCSSFAVAFAAISWSL